jgi:hypothetical protein
MALTHPHFPPQLAMDLRACGTVLVVSHGNTLLALVKPRRDDHLSVDQFCVHHPSCPVVVMRGKP